MAASRPGTLIAVAREVLLDAIRSARSEVFLIAPFLSTEVAQAIVTEALASRARKLKLLTSLSSGSVAGGFLQPAGLRELHHAGFELKSVSNLHAKVSIVDGDWGLVGSGNLTTSGLGSGRNGNVELGVVLTARQVEQAHRLARGWWRKAARVSLRDIEHYENVAKKFKRAHRGRGQGHGPVLPIDAGTQLETARRRNGRTGFWLKMLYPTPGRDDDAFWRTIDWVSDGRPPRDGRLVGGPRYEPRDLLVLYLVGHGCPAIVEVEASARHDPNFVRRHGLPGDWQRWPWVTDVRRRWAVPLNRAPSLSDIGIESASVRQQGRITLSEEQFARARARISPRS